MYPVIKSSNSVSSLIYHLIICIKYRKKVFTNIELVDKTREIVYNIAKDFDVDIIESECGEDHLHILFRAKPSLNLTNFINILKGHSSRDNR
jgi:putative transposase